MTTIRKRGYLYLGWWWSQASGAVARRRYAGRTAAPTKTIGVAYVLWVPSDGSYSAKEELQDYKLKFLAEPPLYGEVSKTCKKKTSTKALISTYGMKAVNDIQSTKADNRARGALYLGWRWSQATRCRGHLLL
jgi:hypothetical protein